MTAGLPGTGIGGLYYLLLVLLMPIHETWRTLRGTSNAARWREVRRHLLLAGSIVGLLVGCGWSIGIGLDWSVRLSLLEPVVLRSLLDASGTWSRTAAFVSLGVLGGVLSGAAGLRGLQRFAQSRARKDSDPRGGTIAPTDGFVPRPNSAPARIAGTIRVFDFTRSTPARPAPDSLDVLSTQICRSDGAVVPTARVELPVVSDLLPAACTRGRGREDRIAVVRPRAALQRRGNPSWRGR